MMNYAEKLGFEIKPINYLSFDVYSLEAFRNLLFKKFGRNFINLLPYINGEMVIYKGLVVDRSLDKRGEYPFVCDILKPETMRAAIETLNDPELNDMIFEFHLKKQDDAIKMAQRIHEKIMMMLGHPDPTPKEKTVAEKSVFAMHVQEVCHVN